MDPRPWYKKKRYIIPAGVLGLVLVGGMGETSSPPTPVRTSPVVQQEVIPATSKPTAIPSAVQNTASVDTTVSQPTQTYTGSTGLSNDNYYTNSAGNQVHSPAYSDTVPAGASARCRDGTYSFSQSRRGTCSHHGGVAEWL